MQASRRLAPLAVGAACGMAAGAVAGLWARVAMRMVAIGVADGVGVRPEFTVAGTLGVVVSGIIMGAPAGLVYALIADRLPGPARWRGLLYALIVLVLIGPFFFRGEEFFSTGRILLFLPPFLLFGIVLALALTPSRAVMDRLPAPVQAAIALTGLGTLALLLFAVFLTLFGLPGGIVM